MKRSEKTLLTQKVVMSGVLTAFILIIYVQSVAFDFVGYDDLQIFAENPHVQGGLTWAGIKWAFTNPNFGLYMPLPTLSFMLDVSLFGSWAGGYHLHNVLWHIAAVLTFYWLLLYLTDRPFESGFAALLMAVHPVNAMVVNWVSARNEIMPAWCGLAAIACYVRYTRSRSWTAYAGIVLFMFLGLLGKQTQVMIPAILLLLDFWPLNRLAVFPFQFQRLTRDVLRLIVEKIPLFALSALGMVFAFWGKLSVRAFEANLTTTPREDVNNAVVSYARYLFHLLYPVDLSFHYPLLGNRLSPVMVLGSGVLLLLISLAVLAALRRGYLAAGWVWYLAALFPVSGFVGYANSSIALRYLYFASLGLFVLLAFAWGETLDAFLKPPARPVQKPGKKSAPAARPGPWQWVRFGGPAVVAILFVPLSFWQTTFWKNTEALAFRGLKVMDGDNAVAHSQLAGIRLKQGLPDQAMRHFRQAYELEPDVPLWQYNYAIMLLQRGRFAEVESLLRESVQEHPTHGAIREQYASSLFGLGRYEEAVPHYQHAIVLLPDNVVAYTNYARCLIALKRHPEALPLLETALKLAPSHAAARSLLQQIQPFLKHTPASSS